MATMQWVPYRWEPVHYAGADFRLTFRLRGDVEAMELVLGLTVHPFTLGEDSAQVVVPEEEAATVPDRAPVQVKIRTGGVWSVLAQGHLTRRES